MRHVLYGLALIAALAALALTQLRGGDRRDGAPAAPAGVIPQVSGDPPVDGPDLPLAGKSNPVKVVRNPQPLTGPTPLAHCPGLPGTVDNFEAEPHMAVNPADSKNMIVAWQQDRSYGARGTLAAWTKDGGRTWQAVRVPGHDTCSATGQVAVADPWLTFDGAGTAYVISLVGTAGPNTNPGVDAKQPYRIAEVRSNFRVNRSRDGGETWSPGTRITKALAFNDKEMITADPRRKGIVYATWERSGGDECESEEQCTPNVYFSRTTDGARTWSEPVKIPTADRKLASHNARVFVTRDGSLRLFYEHGQFTETRRLMVVSSDNRGRTWSTPRLLLTQDNYNPTSPGRQDFYAIFEEAVASDPAGRLYLAYANASGAPTTSPSRVELRVSKDGTHWSAPKTVASVPAFAMQPSVTADETGRVAVTWYDFADDRPNDDAEKATYRTAVGRPGGSWRTGSLGSFDISKCGLFSPVPGLGPMLPWMGEYIGLVPTDHGHFATAFMACGAMSELGPEDVLFGRF